MKVLISIPWFLPAFRAGGPIQSIANMVANFNTNVEYYIFCSNTDLNGQINEAVPFNEWMKFNSYTKVWYDTGLGTKNNFLLQQSKLKPDVLFIIGLFSWKYNIIPLLYGIASKKVLSVRGMLHPGALSQKSIKKKFFLNLFKMFGLKKNISFHVTDYEEANHVKNVLGISSTIYVAGNYARSIEPAEPIFKLQEALQMITVALISPMKNHLLVLQALQQCKFDVGYTIIGPIKDAHYWAQCQQQIALLPQNVKVFYKAEIPPHLIAAELAKAHLFIMPSKSENFGHAIVEALAAGKPVIISNTTPWNELQHYNAGINVDTTAASVLQAILFFVAMQNNQYLQFVDGAKQYAKTINNLDNLQIQYQQMFHITS